MFTGGETYAPEAVRSRQIQLEEKLERAWNHDPIVLLNMEGKSEARVGKGGLPN